MHLNNRPIRHRLPAALLLAGLLLLLLLSGLRASAQTGGQPGLRIAQTGRDEAIYFVRPGQAITIPVEIVDVDGLGAATVLLTYDPQVVQVTGCALPAAAPFDGFCNPSYDLGAVRFNIIAPQGLSASVQSLVQVVFQALDSDSVRHSALSLSVEHFADIQGNDLPLTLSDGSIEVLNAVQPVDGLLGVGDEGTERRWSLLPGDSILVPVTLRISDTHPLAALTALLRYDPQLVRPTQCLKGADPELMGYCNPAFDREAGLLKFNLLSAGGLSGDLTAFDVRFEAASGAWASAISQVTPILEHASDLAGEPLSWRLESGQIDIARGQANSAQVLLGEPAGSGQYAVEQGSVVTVSIAVADVVDLAAATLSLGYDPAVVRPLSCQLDPGLLAAGGGGACNWAGDEVRFSLVAPLGVSGTLSLAQADFAPLAGAAAGASSALSLLVENFANSAGDPIPSTVRNGAITVEPGLPGQSLTLLRADPVAGLTAFSLPLGSQVQVPIRVEGAVDLAAATVALHFDPAVVEVGDCLAAQAPFDGGFCNAGFAPGIARINGLSVEGISGTATLAELSFLPAPGVQVGSRTALTLAVVNLDDASGQAMPYALRGSEIVIEEAPPDPIQATLRAGDAPIRLVDQAQVIVPLLATIDDSVAAGLLTAVLNYDPALVRPVACAINQDPAANGFNGGACNLSYGPGQIRLSALSIEGVSGQTTVAEVTFAGVSQAGGSGDLTLDVILLTDPTSQDLSFDLQAGSLLIPDDDGDSIADYVEFGINPAGDGNDDGLADARQAHVVSLPNGSDGRYVTLIAANENRFAGVEALAADSLAAPPDGIELPVGLLAFDLQVQASGATATTTLALPPDGPGDLFLNYGPTADETWPHWQLFPATWQAGRVRLEMTDGGGGDRDLQANGVISVQGGPAWQRWLNVESSDSRLDGQFLPAGAAVTAFDPAGLACGTAVAATPGEFSPLACFRDDPETAEDEGIEPGQMIAFTVDGHPALPQAQWTASLSPLDVTLRACTLPGDLDCSGQVTVADLQRLAHRLTTSRGQAGFYPPLDRDGDDDIDLADLIRQALDW